MPEPDETGANPEQFLKILGGPAWISIKGKDSSRLRVVVTLLHGNEPSGVKAIHQWLKHRIKPATNVAFFIASIDAALEPRLFTHRYLPGSRDLNRCFNPPHDDPQGVLALSLLNLLKEHKPEVVFDLHNTSSNSEPFAVTFAETTQIRQLTKLVTDSLLLMETRLGSLLEHSSHETPIITIEFGKGTDPRSDHLAKELLKTITHMPSLFAHEHDSVRVLKKPIRLELHTGSSVAYANHPVTRCNVTLLPRIDTYNFVEIQPETIIGWIRGEPDVHVKALSATGQNMLHELLTFNNGKIRTKTTMTLSMATTDPLIAAGDCLAYLIPITKSGAYKEYQ